MSFYKEKDSESSPLALAFQNPPKRIGVWTPKGIFRRCLWVQTPDPHKVFIWKTSGVFPQTVRFYIYLWPFFGGFGKLLLLRSFRPLMLSNNAWHGVFVETSSQEILLEVVDIRHIQQQPSIGLLCCKSFGCFLGSLGFQTPKPSCAQ